MCGDTTLTADSRLESTSTKNSAPSGRLLMSSAFLCQKSATCSAGVLTRVCVRTASGCACTVHSPLQPFHCAEIARVPWPVAVEQDLRMHLEPWRSASDNTALAKKLVMDDVAAGHAFVLPGGEAEARQIWRSPSAWARSRDLFGMGPSVVPTRAAA